MNTDKCPTWQRALSKNIERRRCLLGLGLIFCLILFIPSFSGAEGTTAQMIQSWKDKSNQGDVYAPFQLGFSYQKGQGVKKNLVEAAKWYQLGAERGDFHAALTLADMYRKGEGVQQNEEKAIEWYVKVGKSNGWDAPIARANLLVLVRNYSLGGEGINPNKTKAQALFKRLFEVEMALIERGEAEMNESIQKVTDAADTINNIPKEVFDELKKQGTKN
jgi:TPR repeat protein